MRAAKYPPEGIRGIAGSHRAGGYGRHAAEYWKRANEEMLVVLQVETRAAVDEIDQIVKIPGVDVIFIGPGDLSTALGHMGNPGHPDVQAVFARVEAARAVRASPSATSRAAGSRRASCTGRATSSSRSRSDTALVVQGSQDVVARFRQDIRP